MNTFDIRPLGVALLSIFLGATGQFLFRVGMLSYGKVNLSGIGRQIWQIIFTPAILLGFICFGISSILWLVVISRWELSLAYPMVAFGYLLAIIYGTVFLHETLNLGKILGCLFILTGISVLGIYGRS